MLFCLVAELDMKLLVLILLFLPFICGNKYAKDANVPLDDVKSDEKFRVQKLNFVWSKAIRKLSPADQHHLLPHLKKLDKQFLAAKYERDGGKESEGVTMKDVEKELEKLLKKFGLSELYESLIQGAGSNDGSSRDLLNDAHVAETATKFKDQKLRRLWMDAVAEGEFDGEELAALENEFQHHQSKVEEYEKMAYGDEKKVSKSDEKENSVLHEDYDDDGKSKSNAVLKEKFKDVQRNYDSLKKKVSTMVQSKQSANSISHPRVLPLLEKARSMYSGAELESIEEELRHFETRLKKLEYLKAEADKRKDEEQPAIKKKKEKSTKIHDRELLDQLSDHSRKVDKYERYLASKLEL